MLAMDAQSVGLKDARVHGQSDSSQARTFTHNGDETQSLTILDHEHAVGASRRGSFAMAQQPVRRSPRAKPRMGENVRAGHGGSTLGDAGGLQQDRIVP